MFSIKNDTLFAIRSHQEVLIIEWKYSRSTSRLVCIYLPLFQQFDQRMRVFSMKHSSNGFESWPFSIQLRFFLSSNIEVRAYVLILTETANGWDCVWVWYGKKRGSFHKIKIQFYIVAAVFRVVNILAEIHQKDAKQQKKSQRVRMKWRECFVLANIERIFRHQYY